LVTSEGTGILARFRLGLLIAVLLIIGVAILWTLLDESNRPPSYPYSNLLAQARAGNVRQIVQDGLQLTVRFTDSEQPRTVYVASDAINVYAEVCAAEGRSPGPDCPILFSVVAPSVSGQWIGLLITSLLPVLLIGSFIYFMIRSQQRKSS
jgi:ATP-dependent Zn protease